MRKHRARSKVLAGIAAIALVAIGCNSRLIRPPAIVFADGGEYDVTTTYAEIGYRFPSAFTAFVPSRVPLHPGDALNFEVRDTGEPHTVALGRMVDSAAKAVDGLGVTASLRQIEQLAQMRRLPPVFPNVVRGKLPKVNLSASERCFLDKERPKLSRTGGAPACPETEQPPFDGKQAFYSSGLLEDGEPFRVRLSDDIAAGEYRFMCLVHRSAMSGVIEVRAKETERPAVAELRQEATREEEQIESSLAPSARAAVARKSGPILAGTGPRGTTRGLIVAFIPKDAEAKVGRPVTWRFYRMHSISFRAEREAKEGLFLEGEPRRINPDAWEPVGSRPPLKGIYTYPSTLKAVTMDGGKWDGEGVFSSGVIRATPPTTVSYRMVFTKAGKYAYSCLVHPSMRGTIEVT